VDRKIPRDLETVVLKTIAKEPGKRYATAEMMAEDLRLFLADRPRPGAVRGPPPICRLSLPTVKFLAVETGFGVIRLIDPDTGAILAN